MNPERIELCNEFIAHNSEESRQYHQRISQWEVKRSLQS
jgi:glutamine synthetase